MSEPMREALARQAVFQAFANKLGGKRAMELLSKASDDLAKVQIHDLKGEVFEDIMDRAAQSLFLGEKFELPTFDDVTTMMASMALTRGAMATANGVMGDGGQQQSEGAVTTTPAPVNSANGTAITNAIAGTGPDADIWKPVTGGGIYDVEEEGDAEGQPRVAFSRGEELAKQRQTVKQMQGVAQPGRSDAGRRRRRRTSQALCEIMSCSSIKHMDKAQTAS